jgi:hypothetical protein
VELEPEVLCLDTGYRDFRQSPQENSGTALQLCHDRFPPNPFQFIIHLTFYHSMLYSLATYTVIFLSSMAYSPLLGPGRFFSFLILHTVGRTPWMGDHATYTQNKRGQTSMPRGGFEPTTSVFEQAKTVHALDHAGHCDRLIVI